MYLMFNVFPLKTNFITSVIGFYVQVDKSVLSAVAKDSFTQKRPVVKYLCEENGVLNFYDYSSEFYTPHTPPHPPLLTSILLQYLRVIRGHRVRDVFCLE